MNRQDLALNNLQWLMCYKNKQKSLNSAAINVTTLAFCPK